MKPHFFAAACLAGVIGASGAAFAGITDDIVSVINGEQLPADRSATARSYVAEDACKHETPYAERDKCFTLTADQIEHYVQERRQKAAEVDRQNKKEAQSAYLGCVIVKGLGNSYCDSYKRTMELFGQNEQAKTPADARQNELDNTLAVALMRKAAEHAAPAIAYCDEQEVLSWPEDKYREWSVDLGGYIGLPRDDVATEAFHACPPYTARDIRGHDVAMQKYDAWFAASLEEPETKFIRACMDRARPAGAKSNNVEDYDPCKAAWFAEHPENEGTLE
jgi:hypothetical protein